MPRKKTVPTEPMSDPPVEVTESTVETTPDPVEQLPSDILTMMFYLFHKKNIISPKECYNLLNSMDKGEKEILLAFIKQEIEIEQKKNSLEEV